MARFLYKAIGPDGQPVEGEMDATHQSDVIQRLQSTGHLPIQASEATAHGKRVPALPRLLPGKKRISFQDIVHMTRELATLLNAGLPLDQALESLDRYNSKPALKDLIRQIQSRVKGGDSLSRALEDQSRYFSPLYINLVRAGEAGGSLESVLMHLADYLERMQETRSTVVSALIYPGILFSVSILSIIVLMLFVVPQFIPLFEDYGESLPLLTELVFGSAMILKSWWWAVFLFLAGLVWAIQRWLSIPDNCLRWHRSCLGLPLLGELILKLEVARFARTLSTLLINGVPLLNAVSLVRNVMTNRVLQQDMDVVTATLREGGRMAKALECNDHFPELALQLVQVGENSGQLDAMLVKIADIYDRESQTTIKRMLSLLEPALILGLGGLIGIIIGSVLLAVLGLNELVI